MQGDAEVEQNQREPNYGHGQSPVTISAVEERQDGDIFIGIFGRLQLVLEVLRQGDVVPRRDSPDELLQIFYAATGEEPSRRLGQIEPKGRLSHKFDSLNTVTCFDSPKEQEETAGDAAAQLNLPPILGSVGYPGDYDVGDGQGQQI